jgi:hypothetical protein
MDIYGHTRRKYKGLVAAVKKKAWLISFRRGYAVWLYRNIVVCMCNGCKAYYLFQKETAPFRQVFVNYCTVLLLYTKNKQNNSLLPLGHKIKFITYFHHTIEQTVPTISSWEVHWHSTMVTVRYYQTPQHNPPTCYCSMFINLQISFDVQNIQLHRQIKLNASFRHMHMMGQIYAGS